MDAMLSRLIVTFSACLLVPGQLAKIGVSPDSQRGIPGVHPR